MSPELREKILGTDWLPSEIIDIPEWDVKILMRGLTLERKRDLLRSVNEEDSKSTDRFLPAFIIACAYDSETKELIFGEEDIDALGSLSAQILEKLGQRALALSGLEDGTEKNVESV